MKDVQLLFFKVCTMLEQGELNPSELLTGYYESKIYLCSLAFSWLCEIEEKINIDTVQHEFLIIFLCYYKTS